MRVLALLNMTLDELNERKAKGKGDFVAKLADQLLEDPKAGMSALLDWLGKAAPPTPSDQQPGIAFDIKALYLNAIQTANGHAPGALAGAMTIEHEDQGTSRVHDELTDW